MRSRDCVQILILAMPTTPSPPAKMSAIDRQLAKERIVRVFQSGGDWRLAAYTTTFRTLLSDERFLAKVRQRSSVVVCASPPSR
jgi:hypothetical protein